MMKRLGTEQEPVNPAWRVAVVILLLVVWSWPPLPAIHCMCDWTWPITGSKKCLTLVDDGYPPHPLTHLLEFEPCASC